ncbi:MAG: 3-phenylpropionate/cinnamic acid dioxygenase subunit beta [Acidobacteria bacterium]|nr:MAG: 3-phenylpropionate/cinnamic acid dioxygenase subunit beta [Acidobacteriota bacterium]
MASAFLPPADPLYQQVIVFLYEEARLLDNWRLEEWLTLLADDIVYLMPVRITREKNRGSEFDEDLYHFEENLASLKTRIRRWETQFAWGENPPPRTRRFLSSILVERGDGEDELKVTSSLLLIRNRGDAPEVSFLSAERQDVIRQTPDGLRLARRVILPDQSVLGLESLFIL